MTTHRSRNHFGFFGVAFAFASRTFAASSSSAAFSTAASSMSTEGPPMPTTAGLYSSRASLNWFDTSSHSLYEPATHHCWKRKPSENSRSQPVRTFFFASGQRSPPSPAASAAARSFAVAKFSAQRLALTLIVKARAVENRRSEPSLVDCSFRFCPPV